MPSAAMNLEDFLSKMPVDLGEFLVPATRALLLRRVSTRTRDAVEKLHCRVDVQPGKMIRRMYGGENATAADRREAVQLFLVRSLQLSFGGFRLRSFTLHGMVIGQPDSLNAMLLHASGLQVLDMYNNHIDDAEIGGVFASIPSSLQVLRLARQWINRAAVTPLCALLARLPLLEELDLSENYLNSFGMEALTASVASARLSRVSLGFNHLKSRFWNEHPEIGIDRFVLQKLDVQHNMLQGVFGDSIYACVRGSGPALHDLNVSYNDLRPVGVSYLSAAIRGCCSLRHLNLAGNLCGDAALALLLAAVNPTESAGQCMPLESLDLAHNHLTGASARKFHQCVVGSVLQRSLRSVSFSYNDIFDPGALLVLQALLPCAMTKLGLAEVAMGTPSGMSLAGTMLHWPQLASLDVHGNALCSTSLVLIAQGMSENKSRQKSVMFTGNWGEKECSEQLERIMRGGHTHASLAQARS